jgi:two-component system OmpR family sensor kinase
VEVNLAGAVWKGVLLVGKPTEDLEATLEQFGRIYAGTAF